MHEIYLHRNKIDGKGYVGQTAEGKTEKRWKKHVYDAYKGSPNYFHRAIVKHGPENFESSVVEIIETQAQADDAESGWIKELETLDYQHGYNHTTGGHKPVHTEISRKRNSETTKKQYEDPEFKEMMRLSGIGKIFSAEACENISKGTKQAFIKNPNLREQRRQQRLNYKFPPEFGKMISERKKAKNRHCTEEDKTKKREANLLKKEQFREGTLKQFENPEAREKHSQLTKEYFEDPQNKEKTRQAMLKLYASQRVKKKLQEASNFTEVFESISKLDKTDLEIVDLYNSLLSEICISLGQKSYIPKRRKKSLKLEEELCLKN